MKTVKMTLVALCFGLLGCGDGGQDPVPNGGPDWGGALVTIHWTVPSLTPVCRGMVTLREVGGGAWYGYSTGVVVATPPCINGQYTFRAPTGGHTMSLYWDADPNHPGVGPLWFWMGHFYVSPDVPMDVNVEGTPLL